MEKYIYGQSEMPAFRKYFSMFVRTLVCCLFLLPGRSGMAVIAVLVAGELMFWILQKKRAALINSLLGNLMAVIFGIIARLVYYHAPINKIFS
jgi:hypothetical protein